MSHDPAAEAWAILGALSGLRRGTFSPVAGDEVRGRTGVRVVSFEAAEGGRLDVEVPRKYWGHFKWARLRAAAPADWRRVEVMRDLDAVTLLAALGGNLGERAADWRRSRGAFIAHTIDEENRAYASRNALVAILAAERHGRLRCWAEPDEWGAPVIYAETMRFIRGVPTPVGQVSWHVPSWDAPLIDWERLCKARLARDGWDGTLHGPEKPAAIRAAFA